MNITFDQQGGAKFAKLTTENVSRPFAIILDGKVLSAPNINEPILGGSAQISGSFTVESANQLAIALRSGALPVDLTVIQQGTVGPELGADSIRKGMLALAVGAAAVLVLMVVTYGRFGMYANAALILNVLMIAGHHGGCQHHADFAGDRGLRADDRCGGRCQRADQRTNTRRAKTRETRRSPRSRTAIAKRAARFSMRTSPT